MKTLTNLSIALMLLLGPVFITAQAPYEDAIDQNYNLAKIMCLKYGQKTDTIINGQNVISYRFSNLNESGELSFWFSPVWGGCEKEILNYNIAGIEISVDELGPRISISDSVVVSKNQSGFVSVTNRTNEEIDFDWRGILTEVLLRNYNEAMGFVPTFDQLLLCANSKMFQTRNRYGMSKEGKITLSDLSQNNDIDLGIASYEGLFYIEELEGGHFEVTTYQHDERTVRTVIVYASFGILWRSWSEKVQKIVFTINPFIEAEE